ncbi:hypothetical protein ACFL59_14015, partial [Planctomycetota bacterium]
MNDSRGDEQTQPNAGDTVLGGDERLRDVRKHLLVDTHPLVPHCNRDGGDYSEMRHEVRDMLAGI